LTKRKVLLSRTASRQLERFPLDRARRIRAKRAVLEEDPIRPRSGADIRLVWSHDDPPLYRLRIGEYRVLYFIMNGEVRVTEIVHRSQAYRGLD
jgi:mRNA-degrading endonuclease RelE of RelBE toxin-antitoxin system